MLFERSALGHLYGFPAGMDCADSTPLQVAIEMGRPEIHRVSKGSSKMKEYSYVLCTSTLMLSLVFATYCTCGRYSSCCSPIQRRYFVITV